MEFKLEAANLNVVAVLIVDDFDHMSKAMQPGERMSIPWCAFHKFAVSVVLFPNGEDEEHRGIVRAGFKRDDDSKGGIVGHFDIEILCPGQADAVMKDNTGREPVELAPGQLYEDLGRLDDIRKHNLDANGNLRIRITFMPEFPGVDKIQLDTKANSCTRDLGKLLESEAFSDLTLVVEEKHFRAHRNILSARSPVFQSMLTSRMSESTQAQVVIPDMKAVTMTAFLQFLYTGSCDLNSVDRVMGFSELQECDLVGRWYFADLGDGFFEITQTAQTMKLKKYGSGLLDFGDGADTLLEKEGSRTWTADIGDGKRVILKLNEEFLNVEYERTRHDSTISYATRTETLLQSINAWGQLLKAADKYCVVELAFACEAQLWRRLFIQTAATVLRIASEAGRQDFKRRVLHFITQSETRLRAVKDTRGFDLLDRELALEVLESFLHPRYTHKRPREEHESREFADDEDWTRLSNSQLRRACAERDLRTDGNRESLVRLLQSQNLPICSCLRTR